MNTLTFIFNSGATVKVDMVTEWQVGAGQDGKIVSLSLAQHHKALSKIIVKSINLSSIDCIVEGK